MKKPTMLEDREQATIRLLQPGASDSWPLWPYLPLKHATHYESGFRKLGFMIADEGLKVHVGLLPCFGGSPEGRCTIEFATIDELLADGWRVD